MLTFWSIIVCNWVARGRKFRESNVDIVYFSSMQDVKIILLVWHLVSGIGVTFSTCVFALTEHHISMDGDKFLLSLFFAMNFIFRVLTNSLLCVYWKVLLLYHSENLLNIMH